MTKIAINGFGRIGRQTFRRILDKYPDVEVVAINDLTDTKTLAHLLQYDSNYGVYEKEVKSTEDAILVGDKEFKVFAKKEIKDLPWKELGVDIVLECTGLFTKRAAAMEHINVGAKKVIVSAPCEKETPGFILGVNTDDFDINKVDVMDMGSCTTNCLAPVAKILHENFTIEKGFMNTIHSYTNDQKILDLPHKDLRRARAAALNIIPTSTGAAKAIGKMIPELDGKLDGMSLRVPTPVVSIVDLTVTVSKNTTAEEINDVFRKAATEKRFEGRFRVEENELVSMDFKGDSHSSIVDADQTMVNGNMVKVLAWYDNEWGYSCRLAEFTDFVGKKM